MSSQATPDVAIPAKLFSYAQAARGASSNPSSKTVSGAVTPSKEQAASSPALKQESNNGSTRWADHVEDELKEVSNHSSASTAVDAQSISSMKSPTTNPVAHVNGVTSPSSPEFGASSTSTLAREDTGSPMPDMAESGWESKSTSTAKPEKPTPTRGSADRASSKGRRNKGDRRRNDRKEKKETDASPSSGSWIQPVINYTEAPPPPVNFWQVRAQQSKGPVAKAAVPTATAAEASKTADAPHAEKKTHTLAAVPTPVAAPKPHVEHKAPEAAAKKDEASSSRKDTRATEKSSVNVEKSATTKITSPAVDQTSWPTPEIAQVEDHKKPQQKTEAESLASHVSKDKKAWEKIDFVPSVVFNTPIPAPTARRGGRGGRGGREGSERNGAPRGAERRGESGTATGESSRRDRGDAGVARATSPSRAKRGSNDDGNSRRTPRGEASSKPSTQIDVKPKGSETVDQGGAQASSSSRQVNPPRAKADRVTTGEKRPQEVPPQDNEPATSTLHATAPEHAPQASEAPLTNGQSETTDSKVGPMLDGPGKNQERRTNGSGSYSSFAGRERSERGGRGGHRGGRNSNGFHPGSHAYTNGQAPAAYSSQSYASTPRSPNSFGGQEPYFSPTPNHSTRYGRSFTSRASSIPLEGSYPRGPNGYGGLPHINTGNGMYPSEYGMAASAYPYAPDPSSLLLSAVNVQMEYYFSVDNLIKDMFLRKHMDSQGFVFLSFIAGFKRLKSMTLDQELIKYVCQQSLNIEHAIGSDGRDRLRAANGWDKWVLAILDRDESAQNEGPESVHQPPKPHPQIHDMQNSYRQSSLPMPASAGPVLGGQGYQSLNGFANPYGYTPNGMADTPSASQFQTSPTSATQEQNGIQQPGGAYPGSSSNSSILTNAFEEQELDTFTDGEVECLRVVIRTLAPSDVSSSPPPAFSRTFSNGSLDGRNLAEDLNGLRIANTPTIPSATVTSSEADSRASPAPSDRVNHFLAGNRLSELRNASRSATGSDAGSNPPGIFWVKDKDSPANEIPPDTTTDLYFAARQKALEQRAFHQCPYDMNVMYQFWSHFLIRNFNARMYAEFRILAIEDATARHSYVGLNSLLKYFGGALSHDAPIRRLVARDYVDLVRNETRDSDRPAFKQLRSAWRDGALNMKNRKRVKDFIDPGLESELDRA